MISMTIQGLDEVQGKMKRFIRYSKTEASAITKTYGTKLEQTVKRNASGRPGPNVITGAYRESIHAVNTGPYEVTVGTGAVQAMRLEFGFVGVDSLGRHYQQPPFPHFTPARDEIAPQYVEAMQQAVRGWWK